MAMPTSVRVALAVVLLAAPALVAGTCVHPKVDTAGTFMVGDHPNAALWNTHHYGMRIENVRSSGDRWLLSSEDPGAKVTMHFDPAGKLDIYGTLVGKASNGDTALCELEYHLTAGSEVSSTHFRWGMTAGTGFVDCGLWSSTIMSKGDTFGFHLRKDHRSSQSLLGRWAMNGWLFCSDCHKPGQGTNDFLFTVIPCCGEQQCSPETPVCEPSSNVIYTAKSFRPESKGGHSLWFSKDKGGKYFPGRRFHFKDDAVLVLPPESCTTDCLANLYGTIRRGGKKYVVDFWFEETTGSNPNWRYFNWLNGPDYFCTVTQILPGGDLGAVFYVKQNGSPFQVGVGANAKGGKDRHQLGASGWFTYAFPGDDHMYQGDINIDLCVCEDPNPPECVEGEIMACRLGECPGHRVCLPDNTWSECRPDADWDDDGVPDDCDNCPYHPNPDQDPEACVCLDDYFNPFLTGRYLVHDDVSRTPPHALILENLVMDGMSYTFSFDQNDALVVLDYAFIPGVGAEAHLHGLVFGGKIVDLYSNDWIDGELCVLDFWWTGGIFDPVTRQMQFKNDAGVGSMTCPTSDVTYEFTDKSAVDGTQLIIKEGGEANGWIMVVDNPNPDSSNTGARDFIFQLDCRTRHPNPPPRSEEPGECPDGTDRPFAYLTSGTYTALDDDLTHPGLGLVLDNLVQDGMMYGYSFNENGAHVTFTYNADNVNNIRWEMHGWVYGGKFTGGNPPVFVHNAFPPEPSLCKLWFSMSGGYFNGQKVLFTSNSGSGSLICNGQTYDLAGRLNPDSHYFKIQNQNKGFGWLSHNGDNDAGTRDFLFRLGPCRDETGPRPPFPCEESTTGADSDGDLHLDECDNCPLHFNPDQDPEACEQCIPFNGFYDGMWMADDGEAWPPAWGLLIDDLWEAGKTFSFSFTAFGSSVKVTYDEDDGTLLAEGTVYGGEVDGESWINPTTCTLHMKWGDAAMELESLVFKSSLGGELDCQGKPAIPLAGKANELGYFAVIKSGRASAWVMVPNRNEGSNTRTQDFIFHMSGCRLDVPPEGPGCPDEKVQMFSGRVLKQRLPNELGEYMGGSGTRYSGTHKIPGSGGYHDVTEAPVEFSVNKMTGDIRFKNNIVMTYVKTSKSHLVLTILKDGSELNANLDENANANPSDAKDLMGEPAPYQFLVGGKLKFRLTNTMATPDAVYEGTFICKKMRMGTSIFSGGSMTDDAFTSWLWCGEKDSGYGFSFFKNPAATHGSGLGIDFVFSGKRECPEVCPMDRVLVRTGFGGGIPNDWECEGDTGVVAVGGDRVLALEPSATETAICRRDVGPLNAGKHYHLSAGLRSAGPSKPYGYVGWNLWDHSDAGEAGGKTGIEHRYSNWFSIPDLGYYLPINIRLSAYKGQSGAVLADDVLMIETDHPSLVVNGGFSTGNTAGWQCSAQGTNVIVRRNCNWVLRFNVNRPGKQQCMQELSGLAESTWYKATAQVCTGTNSRGALVVNGEHAQRQGQGCETLVVYFQTGPGETFAKIRLRTGGAGTVRFDNVKVVAEDPAYVGSAILNAIAIVGGGSVAVGGVVVGASALVIVGAAAKLGGVRMPSRQAASRARSHSVKMEPTEELSDVGSNGLASPSSTTALTRAYASGETTPVGRTVNFVLPRTESEVSLDVSEADRSRLESDSESDEGFDSD